jgi:fructose transport system substrate-binding protein
MKTMRLKFNASSLALVAIAMLSTSAFAADDAVKIGLVTRTDSNPFFVKLREDAQAYAKTAGAEIVAITGKTHDDAAGQVAAIEDLTALGVKGILVTPSDAEALNDAIAKARAAGILVIALDGRVSPDSAVDATFATDNLQAGVLQGQWVRAALGDTAPRVALVDGTRGTVSTRERHDGFLKGVGIQEGAPEIIAQQNISNQAEAQTALENFFQKDPTINAVYTVYEPAAVSAHAVTSALGLAGKVAIGSIDGSCDGIKAVADGQVGATVVQFPGKMAELGVQAIVDYAKTGTKPSGFIDSGAVLVTDKPFEGIASQNSAWGLKNCW